MGLPKQAFFEALTEIAREDGSIVVLDADVARSTGSSVFRDLHPERFVSCGVSEQNLMGVAAGMSLVGKKPYASTFAVFAAERPFEIIRNTVAYSNLNVKIVATHAGVSVGPDGASHQANEDVGVLRLLPNMTIVAPSDAAMAGQVARASVVHRGPLYIRLGRSPVADLPGAGEFRIGKAILRREGSDIGLLSYGVGVSGVLEAAERLAEEGIEAAVLEMPTIKPLDGEAVRSLAGSVRAIVCVEEHSIIGGLGGAVAEHISAGSHPPLFRIGIPDEFSESGQMEELLEKYDLRGEGLLRRIKSLYETLG
jgi:transketolase